MEGMWWSVGSERPVRSSRENSTWPRGTKTRVKPRTRQGCPGEEGAGGVSCCLQYIGLWCSINSSRGKIFRFIWKRKGVGGGLLQGEWLTQPQDGRHALREGLLSSPDPLHSVTQNAGAAPLRVASSMVPPETEVEEQWRPSSKTWKRCWRWYLRETEELRELAFRRRRALFHTQVPQVIRSTVFSSMKKGSGHTSWGNLDPVSFPVVGSVVSPWKICWSPNPSTSTPDPWPDFLNKVIHLRRN